MTRPNLNEPLYVAKLSGMNEEELNNEYRWLTKNSRRSDAIGKAYTERLNAFKKYQQTMELLCKTSR